MTKRIQILVIEDNRLLRDGLATLLDSETEFKVVASAEGGSAALQRLQETKPNVVLVDAALGRNRSQRLVESIKDAAPHAASTSTTFGFVSWRDRKSTRLNSSHV